VYSLGKVLHWLFAHEVYDGNEQAYSKRAERRLAERFPAFPEFAFVDELIEGTVRGNAGERVQTAAKLVDWAQTVIDRIEVGGRVLDFTKPIRCLFCGLGTYKALAPLPPIEERLAPTNPATLPSSRFDIYEYMRDAAHAKGFPFSPGGTYSIGPLILTCQHCGNVQEFRLDLAPEAIKNWKP
jgi:hypothetical protein